MSSTLLHPFQTARLMVESFADARTKSLLLVELAQCQLATKQFDAALKTFADIPDSQERRIALLTADFQYLPIEKSEALVKLLESAPQTETLSGRIALGMLDANKVDTAWKLIETAKEPFESDQQQYDFLEKVLQRLQIDDWEKIRRFYRTFTPGIFRDWATLAIVKFLATKTRFDEAEKIADSLVSPYRYSWVYWEMGRLAPAEQAKNFFDKAVEILEDVNIVSNDDETMEMLAAQLRIYGRAAFERNDKETGERLLERSEAAATAVSVPLQRYRLQCFLGKVLVELKKIPSIKEYLAIDEMLKSLSSGSDRSKVLVWLAEADWEEGWTQAVRAAAAAERGVIESERAGRTVDVLKRFAAHQQGLSASNDSFEDVVRLSGETYESHYFNPFAEEDCGCY